ncbi:hypothetical protein [Geothermobacter hydrogeniphilus]|uniref:hypothetical protein n=1 Tax=Geothermobacter hydrogeniphilus TaxID=1969733 RepID=UPI0013050275|nr:hypothetical protein [Geothermobacter hydrogeniphilus]
MEDLWKVSDLGYRLGEWAERAEYEKLLRRFHEDECRENSRRLMYGGATLPAGEKD